MKTNQEFKKTLGIIGLLCLISIPYVSAGQEGHGGVAVVCGQSTQLLDLWEGENLPGHKGMIRIPRSEEAVELQIQKALSKLDTSVNLQNAIEESIAHITANWQDIDINQKFVLTSDIAGFLLPEGCELKNVVVYLSDTQIFKNPKIYNMLSKTDQAALILHEAIYKVFRESSKYFKTAPNSLVARKMVALLMSGENTFALPLLKSFAHFAFGFERYNEVLNGDYYGFPMDMNYPATISARSFLEQGVSEFRILTHVRYRKLSSSEWISPSLQVMHVQTNPDERPGLAPAKLFKLTPEEMKDGIEIELTGSLHDREFLEVCSYETEFLKETRKYMTCFKRPFSDGAKYEDGTIRFVIRASNEGIAILNDYMNGILPAQGE